MDNNIFDIKINNEIGKLNETLTDLVLKYREEYNFCETLDDIDSLNKKYAMMYFEETETFRNYLNCLIKVERANPRYDEETDMYIVDLKPTIDDAQFKKLYKMK